MEANEALFRMLSNQCPFNDSTDELFFWFELHCVNVRITAKIKNVVLTDGTKVPHTRGTIDDYDYTEFDITKFEVLAQ